MKRFIRLLQPVFRTFITHPGKWLTVVLCTALLGGYLASHLTIDTDISNLLPQDHPTVEALETLRATVGGESEAAVVIESPSFKANRTFAEDLIPRVLTMERPDGTSYFSDVDYRRDAAFLKDNALYFATQDELERLDNYLEEEIREAKLRANPFYVEVDEESDSEADSLTQAELTQIYDQLVAKEYPISEDSTTMVLRFYPTGAQTNIGFIDRAFTALDSVVTQMNPASYHADMEISYGGRLLRQMIEVRAITRDVQTSFGAGVTAVLILVLLYFGRLRFRKQDAQRLSWRDIGRVLAETPSAAVIIGIPLLISLLWTFGTAYLVVDNLNLMTSTLGLVLFGLGIDYGVHYYSRYLEERADGRSFIAAAEHSFTHTGEAILVSGLTTAAALFVLTLASFKGFSEFGLLAGTGIISALIAMLFVLPPVVRLLEWSGWIGSALHLSNEPVESGRSRPFPYAGTVVVLAVIGTVAALIAAPFVRFEYQFGKLEPTYDEYEEVAAKVSRVYSSGGKRNPAYFVTDTPEQASRVAEELRERARRDTVSPSILSVETLQERFPLNPEAQQKKLKQIAQIRTHLDNQFIERDSSAEMMRLRRASQTDHPIPLAQVPENLRNQFITKDGSLGNLVMVYPSVGLSDGRNSMAFYNDVGRVELENGQVYHGASTPLAAAAMLKLVHRESPWMILLTFVLIAALMLLIFRSGKWASFALLPLVVGIVWMLGLMVVFGVRLTFYNLVVLPAVLGIGNDAGVHMVHRYREEGKKSLLHVLQTTGRPIVVGSLTTMIGFSGMLLSYHPGLQTMGDLAVTGIGTTLLASLVFLPALLQYLEDRGMISN